MEKHLIHFQIAGKVRTECFLNPSEAVMMIQQHLSSWIYADNQFVHADQVDEANLSTVSSVRILPALVNGPPYSPHGGEEE